jgi:hypothetical protein
MALLPSGPPTDPPERSGSTAYPGWQRGNPEPIGAVGGRGKKRGRGMGSWQRGAVCSHILQHREPIRTVETLREPEETHKER